jgi:ABC-type transport system involved in cytochrome bd biosynthesis fused ATPase/permease subunit
MSIVDTHFKLMIEKFNLHKYYYMFMFTSYASTLAQEMINWSLLIFSKHVKSFPENIKTYSFIIFGLIMLYIGLYRLNLHYQSLLTINIKVANYTYYKDLLVTLNKSDLLNINIVHYYTTIYNINKEYEAYINNIKVRNDLPIIYITLFVIAFTSNNPAMIIFVILYFFYVEHINSVKSTNEKKLIDLTDNNVVNMENYFTNSKHLLINDEFNNEYYNKQINIIKGSSHAIDKMEQNIYTKTNVLTLLGLIVLIYSRMNELDQFTFYYFFALYYDLEYITGRQNEYHNHCIQYVNLDNRIMSLEEIAKLSRSSTSQKSVLSESSINQETINSIKTIVINKIENKLPVLSLKNKIIINENDHILVSGVSGSGKSTLLYLLKGIIKVDTIDINPSLEKIYNQTYINIPNHKGVYSGLLYDIISNYNSKPDIELINTVILLSKFKTNSNILIEVNKISAGELMRLVVAHILYSVKSNNKYNILLFDEIDTGLNDELSIEVCTNLRYLFKDKIILYITHNEQVKKTFNKVITVNDGNIN